MKRKLKTPEPGTMAARLWKYRYVLLLALLGALLLLIPGRERAEPASEPVVTDTQQTPERDALEARLETALAAIDGAGEVQLVLTWRDDGEVVYQSDERTSGADGSTSTERTTASISSGSSAEQALIVKTRAPTCAGALVVCEGGGSAAVRLAITDALRALTGLGADSITVVKMKSS